MISLFMEKVAYRDDGSLLWGKTRIRNVIQGKGNACRLYNDGNKHILQNLPTFLNEVSKQS